MAKSAPQDDRELRLRKAADFNGRPVLTLLAMGAMVARLSRPGSIRATRRTRCWTAPCAPPSSCFTPASWCSRPGRCTWRPGRSSRARGCDDAE